MVICMKDIKQCVYKYIYKDSIIYIGKTDSSLKQRIKEHSKEEKFYKYLSDVKIYFIKLRNKAETSFMETYLINKYKPVLNVTDVYDGDSGINIDEPEWIEYSENDSRIVSNDAITALRGLRNIIARSDEINKCFVSYNMIGYYAFRRLPNRYEREAIQRGYKELVQKGYIKELIEVNKKERIVDMSALCLVKESKDNTLFYIDK